MANKVKTHRGAAKRFKKTKKGRFKHKQSHARHILTKKGSKRKRQLRGLKVAEDCHSAQIKQMIPDLQ